MSATPRFSAVSAPSVHCGLSHLAGWMHIPRCRVFRLPKAARAWNTSFEVFQIVGSTVRRIELVERRIQVDQERAKILLGLLQIDFFLAGALFVKRLANNQNFLLLESERHCSSSCCVPSQVRTRIFAAIAPRDGMLFAMECL